MNEHTILTLEEMAKNLGITREELKWMTKAYRIPCIKFNSSIFRFEKNTVRKYLRKKGIETPNNVKTFLVEVEGIGRRSFVPYL